MKANIDTYTKVIQTIIAACLVYMVGKDIFSVPEAHAQTVHSLIQDVNIKQIDGAEYNPRHGWKRGLQEVFLPVQVVK